MNHGGNWITTLLPFVIIAVVLAWRFRFTNRERPLKLGTLWVVPAIYLVIAGSMLVVLPPPADGWAVVALGTLVGAVLGWHRGKLIHIERSPESGELRQRASPLAMLLVLAIVVLKLGARTVFGASAATQAGGTAMLLTDAFIGFALGLLSATRVEIYVRARKLLSA